MSNQLLVFLRNPVPGKVKTRLAAELGNEKALEIYIWLQAVTRNAIRACDAEVYLFLDSLEGYLPDWIKSYKTYAQRGEDIGERMRIAFIDRLFINPNSSVIVIGSDCPEMDSETINSAFQKLETHDVVLGPASDGGVYLIGLKKWHEALFENIQWSTGSVCSSLYKNISALELSMSVLEEKSDIDTPADFLPYREEFQSFLTNNHAIKN